RMYRDEILQIQVDGTAGSAVAGFHQCVAQAGSLTPTMTGDTARPVVDERANWAAVPATSVPANPFRLQWEDYLRDVAAGRAHLNDLTSAARGVQLAELAQRSADEGRRLDVPSGR